MKNWSTYSRIRLSLLCYLFFITACTTLQPKDSIDTNSNFCLSACYQEYQIALYECETFLNYEKRIEVKDRLTIQCLTNKGFARAIDTCKDRCLK
jgi:hypothetical protein